MKKALLATAMVVSALNFVACSKGSDNSDNKPAPAQTNAGGSPKDARNGGSPPSRGGSEGSSNGQTITGECPPQVLADLEPVNQICSNARSLSDMGPCQQAHQDFAAKYPNIECTYHNGGNSGHICNSTNNPALNCSKDQPSEMPEMPAIPTLQNN